MQSQDSIAVRYCRFPREEWTDIVELPQVWGHLPVQAWPSTACCEALALGLLELRTLLLLDLLPSPVLQLFAADCRAEIERGRQSLAPIVAAMPFEQQMSFAVVALQVIGAHASIVDSPNTWGEDPSSMEPELTSSETTPPWPSGVSLSPLASRAWALAQCQARELAWMSALRADVLDDADASWDRGLEQAQGWQSSSLIAHWSALNPVRQTLLTCFEKHKTSRREQVWRSVQRAHEQVLFDEYM